LGIPKRYKGKFIKALPLDWIVPATVISGSATKMALLIWYLSGINKTEEDLVISYTQARKFNISRRSVSNSLRLLENADLIIVARTKGRAPRVSIVYKEEPDKQ